MWRWLLISGIAAGVLSAERPALAQASEVVYPRPLDAGYSDISPLGTSLMLTEIDTRAVRSFDDVYRVPGQSGLLMRQSGAISAVFNQSDYVSSEDGVITLIPAGTVFYIGRPPAGAIPSLELPGSDTVTPSVEEVATQRVSHGLATWPESFPLASVRARRASEAARGRSDTTQAPAHAEGGAARMITISDEMYRRRRLKSIARQIGSS